MKKIFSLLLIMMLFLLSSCSNDVETYEKEIKLIIPDEYLEYLPYEEIPSYTLEFPGKLNISPRVKNSNEICFVTNDDFALSEIISKLLNEYEEKGQVKYVTISVDEKSSTKMNTLKINEDGSFKQESHKLNVIDNKIYNKYAYISLDNGLSLSMNFRTFISDYSGKEEAYYAWQYTANIRLYLHYPFIVTKENDSVKLVLIPLPTGVSYAVGTNLSLKRVTESDDWLDEEYSKFRYFGYNDEEGDSSINLEESIKEVKDYYVKHHKGYEENENFYFEYLSKRFMIQFTSNHFKISIVE